MTDKVAIWLGAVVVAFFVADFVFYDWAMTLFLGRKFYEFIDWLAFWR